MNTVTTAEFILGDADRPLAVAPHLAPTLEAANNLFETENAYWLQVALPGADATTLRVDIGINEILIHGRRHVPSIPEATYLRQQLQAGPFEAAFHLPEHIDATRAEAQYTEGLLTIWLPKVSPWSMRRIAVAAR